MTPVAIPISPVTSNVRTLTQLCTSSYERASRHPELRAQADSSHETVDSPCDRVPYAGTPCPSPFSALPRECSWTGPFPHVKFSLCTPLGVISHYSMSFHKHTRYGVSSYQVSQCYLSRPLPITSVGGGGEGRMSKLNLPPVSLPTTVGWSAVVVTLFPSLRLHQAPSTGVITR